MKDKDSRSTYIIIALICLILFNLGTILINITKDRIKTDFNGEVAIFKDGSIFVSLISRTSSIFNLYRSQYYPESPVKETFYNSFSIANNLMEFIRSQFPSIMVMNGDLRPIGEPVEERDIENNPSIVEDLIIIDRLEEYENLIIIDDSNRDDYASKVPKPLNIAPLIIDRERPYILIYHTHGTESYSSFENDIHHTTDKSLNVIRVGQVISEILEERGHKVEHVTKYHDVPSYSKSYSQSLKTISAKLKENDNFKVLLDIHRDGFDHKDSSVSKNLKNLLEKTKINIEGKDVATFFFVIGPDSPNKEAVLSFAKYIKAVTDVLYPGLCTGILIKPVGKYNQFLSDYSALIEVGSNLNTIEEALETAKILGEILSIAIDNIQE
ncbi:stage II sporulation protein P [Tepidimicrobium xylanilyticum]|uniref:Stage II sporulation protein P n=1 Tax=Tepidimicrobium xylanilyticum TaxID=1123352 RepID=A0A1H2T746_9FIRM|nr:stage II sporulation protein P [Tepidimicrobium xylanilyticum]GMG96023.1 hypothetical protein EN5CB1_08490 [Tepidimicrobium xylanilyticum]SDW39099.1 stage II sporulation protein P [Tepidimicrobium xylanilyticum]